jgi:methyl-accepting chemotaxis protein
MSRFFEGIKNRGIKFQIIATTLAINTLFIVVMITLAVSTLIRTGQKNLDEQRELLMQGFDDKCITQTENAKSLLQQYYLKWQAGELTEEEARTQGADAVRNLRYDGDNYFWVHELDGSCVVLYGSAKEGTNRWNEEDVNGYLFIQGLIANAKKADGGFIELYFPRQGSQDPKDAIPKRAYSNYFAPFGWEIGTGSYYEDIDALLQERTIASNLATRNNLFLMLGAALVLLVSAPLLSLIIANSITRPIRRVSEAVEEVAQGNLTVELNMDGKNEVIAMSQNLDKTVRSLSDSVTGVKQVASEVKDFTETLTSTTEKMSIVTGEVTAAIHDVARGTSSQAAELSEIVNMFNIFSAEMDGIHADAGRVGDSSQTAAIQALHGKDQVADLTSSIASIGTSFGSFMETISNLGLSVDKIGDITDAINAISDQTNLLALNAAIEAARAGEHGKGFAVVSDEVRNLAAESKKSSEEIMELIRRVSLETQGVIKASEDVNTLLNNQEQVINKTVESFQVITDSIHTISPLVESTKLSLNKAAQAKENVIARVEGVASVSEEVSASAEEIAAASEALLSNIEQVSGVSHKMHHSVYTLTDRVDKYKTHSYS